MKIRGRTVSRSGRTFLPWDDIIAIAFKSTPSPRIHVPIQHSDIAIPENRSDSPLFEE
jgi:hypothetical protein